ncbi:MAG: hypothetical protein COB89_07545 [Piscirickettsiaceae bacterium]|nr:MAG: hypothetical protein COB89_07545 [Piscirickettsiaceae bacterium]
MFEKRYMAILADTEESKSIHYALRHQVYCQEKGFLDSSDIALETDRFDTDAVHFLVRDLLKSKWVGTLRVILPKQNGLPMMQIIGDDLLRDKGLLLNKVAEISRLSIISQHRNKISVVNEHSFSEVMFSLVSAAKHYCESLGIDTWVFLCRKSLSKIANRQGMAMNKIGGPYEYKGDRYPYVVNLDDAFTGLEKISNKLHKLLHSHQSFQRYSEFLYKPPSAEIRQG